MRIKYKKCLKHRKKLKESKNNDKMVYGNIGSKTTDLEH
jgi:hypothetical protein